HPLYRLCAMCQIKPLCPLYPLCPSTLVLVRLQMLPEQIPAEIAVKVAPHRMNMVSVILCVVVLDEEGRPLDSIVVFLAALGFARPCKPNLLDAGFLHLRRPIGGNVG